MEMDLQKKSLKKHFLMIFSLNLRPLYNRNVAKVSIVKWSQKQIFVDGSATSELPIFLEIAVLM